MVECRLLACNQSRDLKDTRDTARIVIGAGHCLPDFACKGWTGWMRMLQHVVVSA